MTTTRPIGSASTTPASRTRRPPTVSGTSCSAASNGRGHPTAIFAASDTIAIGLLQAAYQHGVRVPEELSIVGFDDVDAAAYMIPPLTTVDQRGTEMGTLAAGLILDMIEKQRPVGDVDDVVVTPRLVVRRSTATARVGERRSVTRDRLEVEQR